MPCKSGQRWILALERLSFGYHAKEDMLQVEYPNCFLLDMGWYQDRYIISIIQNFDWTHPVQQYETAERNQLPKLLTEAVRLVEKESQSAGAN